MAKVRLNPVLEAIRGKVGDLVFKEYKHMDIVSRMPDRTGVVATVNQLAQQNQFRLAVLYGKAVMADPESKEIYDGAGARKGLSAFAVSVGDFLNPPVVEEIDLSAYTGQIGQVIRVTARDDVQIQGVSVAILDQGGEVLEQGVAVWTAASATWAYTTTTALSQGQSVSIEVSATDRPGNEATRSQARS